MQLGTDDRCVNLADIAPAKQLQKKAMQWLNLVDFLAIAPYYVSLRDLARGCRMASKGILEQSMEDMLYA